LTSTELTETGLETNFCLAVSKYSEALLLDTYTYIKMNFKPHITPQVYLKISLEMITE